MTKAEDSLFEKLKEYQDSDYYPYHMPGHKRKSAGNLPKEIAGLDITEIEGFDNLHDPQGVILSIQEEAAKLYGSEECFLQVNGSTGGILSAISTAVNKGGKLLIARNCHKSIYNAAYLRGIELSFLYPDVDECQIAEPIRPDQVEKQLDEEKGISAVLIVSPTYEGRIARVREIAKAVHERGIPLIVDEAHGAHLGLAAGFPENSCQAGADLVIQSVHKTLPALTQTALLHVNGSLIDRDRLKRFRSIYQSSSPSYLLMASIDNALRVVKTEGDAKFAFFREQYLSMLERLKSCRYLEFPCKETPYADIGKLLISGRKCGISGYTIYHRLRECFHLQPEMAAADYCLLMFTINDTTEAYERLIRACEVLDAKIKESYEKMGEYPPVFHAGASENSMIRPKKGVPFCEAWDWTEGTEEVSIADAEGRCAGEFINLYPPGIPFIIPGEKFTAQIIQMTAEYLNQGFKVQGVDKREDSADKIYVKVLR